MGSWESEKCVVKLGELIWDFRHYLFNTDQWCLFCLLKQCCRVSWIDTMAGFSAVINRFLKVMIFFYNFWTGCMEYRSESQSDRLFGAKQEPEPATPPQRWTRPLCLPDLGTGTPSSQCDSTHRSEDNGSYGPCRDK